MPIKPPSQATSIATNDTKKNGRRIDFHLSEPVYSKKDLILDELVKLELDKAINFKRYHDDVFMNWGLSETFKNNKKVIINLYGAPGTGKTMAAHAIASELEKKILHINYADIESKYVGETPKNIQDAFYFAHENDAVIFFDEADAILSRRVTNMSNATDTSVNQTRSVLLNILNSYDKTVIFATNFIENYDPAFIRRILISINFTLPNEETIREIFKKYIPKKLPNNINIELVSSNSIGLSPSEIANSILLSSFSAKTKGLNLVTTDEVITSINSIKDAKNKNNKKEKLFSIKDIEVENKRNLE
ncbi:ATP-binding protein [Providencia sp. SKLX146130]|uniref:ATP-binding protein n=1 Tax=Providencia zhejiangensis TaxID=3342829 RepID=UPI0035C12EE4